MALDPGLVQVVTPVILGLVSGGVGKAVVDAVKDRRTVTVTAEQIITRTEAEAAENTRRIVEGYGAELERMRARLDNAEAVADRAKTRADAAEQGQRALLRRVDAYEDRVQYLTARLESAGVAVTPWTAPA